MYSSNNMVINNHPIIAVLTLWNLGWGMAQAVELCDPKLSHLVSAQGQVEVARSPADAWETVTPEQGYCGDDKLRTGDLSRAVLSMDQDATLLALDQQTLLSFMKNADRTVLAVEKGQVHIRSHTPTRFDVTTPFVNAGIEGTEFVVNAKDTSVDISVLEGRVRVFNQYGEIFIRKGQTAQSEPDKAPVLKQIDIRPNDAIRWALYYPPIIDFSAVAHQTKEDSLQKVFEHYQNGDIVSALHVLEHSNLGRWPDTQGRAAINSGTCRSG